MLEIYERIVASQLVTKLLARHQRAGFTDEQSEDTKKLVGQQDASPVLRELTRAQIQGELAKPHDLATT